MNEEKLGIYSEKVPEKNWGHMVARTQKYSSYPDRVSVDIGTTWENVDKQKYNPPYYVSEIVLAKPVWADDEDLSKIGRNISQSYEGEIRLDNKSRPLNPRGPTGIEGRGVLGGWGANFAADPIVTRINDQGFLELIVIKRKDCGKWALPGGMVDKGERITRTLNRELGEEASANLDFEKATLVYQGYVDDPRNTDNAWMETDTYHLHLTENEANSVVLKAEDDAADARWMVLDEKEIEKLYASHAATVKKAIALFQENNNLTVLENGKVIQKEIEKYFPLALIIGRFQPFSENHEKLLKEIVRKYHPRKILLGIGVAEKMDERNFLTFDEIKEMVTPFLDTLGVEYELRAVPDINNPPKYGEHVESIFPEMTEDNTQLFTDNTYTSDCFVNYGHNYKVVDNLEIDSKVRATFVRGLMVTGGDWQKYVLPQVAECVKRNDYIKRLKKLRDDRERQIAQQ